MKVHFTVKTKKGDVHTFNSRAYEVVKIKKVSKGWRAEVKKR